MKKLFFVLAASAFMMLAAQTAHAQLYFGGSVGFTTTSQTNGANDTKTTGSSYKLAPEIGYQISDKIAAGASITFQQGIPYMGAFDPNDLKSFLTASTGMQADLGNTGGNGSQRFNGIRIAPYFRYYLFDSRRFDLFVDAMFAYGTFKQETKVNGNWTDDQGTKFNLLEIGARPGFRLKFDNGHFSIVGRLGTLGYQNLTLAGTARTGFSRFGFDIDTNNIMLGFVISL